MRLALVQQHASMDTAENLARGLRPFEIAARAGAQVVAFAAMAREFGVVCIRNLFERDGDHTFDCSPVIDADGSLLGRTRMIHITEYACFHERGYYTPGDTDAPVLSDEGWCDWRRHLLRSPFSGIHVRARARRRRSRHCPAGRVGGRVA